MNRESTGGLAGRASEGSAPAARSYTTPYADEAIDGAPLFGDTVFGDAAFGDAVFGGEDGYSSFHDVDTSAEVDAAFRSQRRIALGHFTVFLIGIVGLGLSILLSDWAIGDRVVGGFSPSFLLAAIGLYGLFVVIAVAGASLANGVDNKMLGASSLPLARSRQSGNRRWWRRRGRS